MAVDVVSDALALDVWVEIDGTGDFLDRSPAAAALFSGTIPPVRTFSWLMARRNDVRDAVADGSGLVRFALGRGDARRFVDASICPGVSGVRLTLTEVSGVLAPATIERMMAAHIARLPVCLSIYDADGILVYCDDAFCELVGLTRAEALGRDALTFYPPEIRDVYEETILRPTQRDGVTMGETMVARNDGAFITVFRGLSAVRADDGRITHYMCMARALDREREIERLRSIDDSVRLIARLTGHSAHRLNNLAAEIMATCDRALLSSDPASAGEALGKVQSLATALGGLGREMLALSTPGAMPGPTDLGQLARDLVAFLRLAAGETGPQIDVVASSGPWVAAGPDAIVRSCIHFALRAMEVESIGRRVAIGVDAVDGRGTLRLVYTPTPTERARLRWMLVEGGAREFLGQAREGGLALVLEDLPGSAIAIVLSAPLSRPPHAMHSTPPSVRGLRHTRLVVAEDNDELRILFAETLASLFEEVVAVGDGDEALAALAKADTDLLVLDLRMPKKHGLEVLAEARVRWPDLRVIVVSGAAPDGVAQTAMASGARAVLAKPFHLRELRAVVRSVLADAGW